MYESRSNNGLPIAVRATSKLTGTVTGIVQIQLAHFAVHPEREICISNTTPPTSSHYVVHCHGIVYISEGARMEVNVRVFDKLL